MCALIRDGPRIARMRNLAGHASVGAANERGGASSIAQRVLPSLQRGALRSAGRRHSAAAAAPAAGAFTTVLIALVHARTARTVHPRS